MRYILKKIQAPVRVLIVEDHATSAMKIERLIENMGYQCVGISKNGIEAINMTCEIKPDVILMDVEMPEMGGFEATRQIQKNTPTPVVMLTGHDSDNFVKTASTAGASAYLVKPPIITDIHRAIMIAMARHNDILELQRINVELATRNAELKNTREELIRTLDDITTLSKFLPICSYCNKIRDDKGYWHKVSKDLLESIGTEFSHGCCDECLDNHPSS